MGQRDRTPHRKAVTAAGRSLLKGSDHRQRDVALRIPMPAKSEPVFALANARLYESVAEYVHQPHHNALVSRTDSVHVPEDNIVPTYNFSQISGFEFESLCRDLLQAELGLSLELFAPGPDGGIDIRYIGEVDGEGQTIVAQCKRWDENSANSLLRHLRNVELPKIRELAPDRYIVMTSVGLTPAYKSRIVEVLNPWVKSASDVMGRDDISGLLAKHQDVERRHVKLWLTSTEVLYALLNSGIFNRSEDALELAQQQLRLWVPNQSYSRAHEILEANKVCVIAGGPGIGKSMLAHILLTSHASQRYEIVSISEDIDEGDRAWRPNLRQVFLYDDFLGRVTFGELHLRKNEETRLSRFLDRVRKSENKKFILTTREYILIDAARRYESLADREMEPIKSIISLEDYTPLIRARILYNHLYFSNLPDELKTAVLRGERYREVIHHPNYNPRVIEYAVDPKHVSNLSPDEFVSNLFATLEDPTIIWARIFADLSDMAQRVLRAITSLPAETFLGDVQDVVKRVWPADFDSGRFSNAVAVIEGMFVDLKEASPGTSRRDRLVAIRNPSVRDYLWARLESDEIETEMLLESALFFEQCVILYEGRNHANSNLPTFLRESEGSQRARHLVNHEKVASQAIELIAGPSPVVRNFGGWHSERAEREPMDLGRRAAFLLSMLEDHPTSPVVADSAARGLKIVVDQWEARGSSSSAEMVRIIRQAVKVRDSLHQDILQRAEQTAFDAISGRLDDTQDFEALVEFAELDTNLFKSPNLSLEAWAGEFENYLDSERDWLLEEIDDPDWLGSIMEDIRKIAEAIGVDVDDLGYLAEDRMQELRESWEPDIDFDGRELNPDPEDGSNDESDAAEIDNLFQSLREYAS